MMFARVAGAKSATLFGTALLCAIAPSAVAATNPYTGVSPNSAVQAKAGAQTFRFNFDHGETLKPGTRVRDVSGHGHFGIVKVSGNGHLTVLDNGVKGRAAGFPRARPGAGRAIIKIESEPALNPRKRPFSFGASVRVTPKQAPHGKDPNILTKGSDTTSKWKLHLITAKPRCVFTGAATEIILTSPDPIDNGTWHRVVCSRSGKIHQLLVDGALKDQSTNAFSGKFTSRAPVKVGGRAVGKAGHNDQFHGDLDNVFLQIQSRG